MSSFFEKVAQDQQGTQSPAAEEARWRQDQQGALAEQPEVLDVAPEKIRQVATDLSGLITEMAVPAASAEALARLAQITDPNIDYVAPVLLTALKDTPRLAEAASISTEELVSQGQQSTELRELRSTAAQVRSDAMDTRRIAAMMLRRMTKGMMQNIREQLAPGSMPRKDQEVLRSDASEVLELADQVESEPLLERQRTQAGERKFQEELEKESRKGRLLSTMLSLRGGEQVPQEEWDEAAALYDEMQKTEETSTRRQRRR